MGLLLFLLWVCSFVGGWSQVPCGTGSEVPCRQAMYQLSLWDGFGVVPGLFLVAATCLLVGGRRSELQVRRPVLEAVVWVVLAVVEIGLFFLYFLIGRGGYAFTNLDASSYAVPGWPLWVAVALVAAIGVTGVVRLLAAGAVPAPELGRGTEAVRMDEGAAPPTHITVQIDVVAAIRHFAAHVSIAEIIMAPALFLLLVCSFLGGWFLETGTFCLNSPCASPSSGILWDGYGILPGVLLVAAFIVFVVGHARFAPAAPRALGSLLWIAFAVVEAGLLLLYWQIGRSYPEYNEFNLGGPPSPGWAFWVSMGLAIVLAAGGCVRYAKGDTRGAPPPGEIASFRESTYSREVRQSMVSRARLGDSVIGASLALMFAVTLVYAWFQVSTQCVLGLPCVQGFLDGSLWDGFGVLPALLLIAAIVLFVIGRTPQLSLALPVPESLIWAIFGLVEIPLLFLYWLLGSGYYQGTFEAETPTGETTTVAPGWALWAAVVLALTVGVAGGLRYVRGGSMSRRSSRVAGLSPD